MGYTLYSTVNFRWVVYGFPHWKRKVLYVGIVWVSSDSDALFFIVVFIDKHLPFIMLLNFSIWFSTYW